MAKRLQHRGGTTSQHSTFTGAVREVTVDTDKNTLVVHDGATAGGHPLATATNFTSTGIDDNATSTAITIDSSENVGISTSSPSEKLEVNGTVKATQFVGGGLNPFRNIIINGDMSIAQRGTSVSSITATDYYTADRFQTAISNLGTWTQSQSTDVPTGQGFATSLKLDCTTADATPSANDVLFIAQKFEGQNLQYLKKGTASAVSLTASFWVKSTKTGTFILELRDTDNGRTISKSYTVNTTNTWEKKTITFEGDTTGAFTNDNGNSLDLNFYLGAGTTYTSGTLQTTWGSIVNANRAVGQVNIADSTSNDFYITGVQLEAGTTASDFEFLPRDVNLQRCYRYCYVPSNVGTSSDGYLFAWGYTDTGSKGIYFMSLPTLMRAQPSLVLKDIENALEQAYYNAQVTRHNTNIVTRPGTVSSDKILLLVVSGASFNNGTGVHLRFSTQSIDETSFVVSAEL